MVHVARQAGNAGPGGGGGEEARRGPTQGGPKSPSTKTLSSLHFLTSASMIHHPCLIAQGIGLPEQKLSCAPLTSKAISQARDPIIMIPACHRRPFPRQPMQLVKQRPDFCIPHRKRGSPSSPLLRCSCSSCPTRSALIAIQTPDNLSIPSNRFISNTEKTSLSQELRWPKDEIIGAYFHDNRWGRTCAM